MSSELGQFLPTATAKLRPEAARELSAFGAPSLYRGKRVLDIGTGDGRLALGAARWAREVTGIDPDPAAIREARANARAMHARTVRFVAGPAQRLPFRADSFDLVILSWSL